METQKPILYPDFCVIGAGSGGLSFAAGTVQMGATVVLLERHKMGGDCLNTGCVPSKALIAAAKVSHTIHNSSHFGWSVPKSSVDFKKVQDRVQQVIQSIAPHDSVERFETLGVKVLLEEGKFINETTLETPTHLIQAKRYIIATGSTPFIPPIQGIASVPYLTNDSIFDLQELPNHLVIIGGGPIGIEMAQAFRRFGSKVTVLEALSLLPKDDPELVCRLKEILLRDGIDIHEGIHISSVAHKDSGIILSCINSQGKPLEFVASHLFIATGRRPTIQDLNLEMANIESTPKGISVDNYLRTTNPRIYALGDCIGGYQFTHMANYHAGLVIRNSIFRLRTKIETRAIPWVTYTDPELAHVGFLESQLKAQNMHYKILQLPFSANDRAQTEGKQEGHIKVLVTPKGKILGATILGSQAGELIYPWVIAIQNDLKLTAITNSIAPYPTLNELSKRVAGSFYAEKLFGSFMKCLVRFIMRMTR